MEIGGTSAQKLNCLPSPPRAHSTLGHGKDQNQGTGMSLGISAFLNHTPDLMTKLNKVSYSSPPPVACNPENNVCKLIEYRSAKVAAFMVNGKELICLPQAFELFLKHLVGGLHTVYTKLKRLDITPIVCNVEQVRILRGLGAIQPGVNRCKLISCKEFDILYEDCTNSSARPGRPPKRSPSLNSSSEALEKSKKPRFNGLDFYTPQLFADCKQLPNGFPSRPYSIGPIPFMALNHPMFSPPVTLPMASQIGHGSNSYLPKNMSQSSSESSFSHLDGKLLRSSHTAVSHATDDYMKTAKNDDDSNIPLNLHVNSNEDNTSGISSYDRSDDEEDVDDENITDDDKSAVMEDSDMTNSPRTTDGGEKIQQDQYPSNLIGIGELASFSSFETLLFNIQGLLKVAADNAKHWDRQLNLEKTELKMEIYREKRQRQEVEKQLAEQQKQKVTLLRRLKRERRFRRRLEEKLVCSERRSLVLEMETPNGIKGEAFKLGSTPSDVENSDKFTETYHS